MSKIVDTFGRIVVKEPAIPDTREFKEGVDYKVSLYDGKFKNFECMHCQFASLYWSKLEEHFAYETNHQHKWANPVPVDQQKQLDDGPQAAKY